MLGKYGDHASTKVTSEVMDSQVHVIGNAIRPLFVDPQSQ